MLAAALACTCLLAAAVIPASAATRFTDVPTGHWAEASITRAAELNLLGGRSDGTFGMGQPMTRAAFATALCRLFAWEPQSPTAGSFDDNQDAGQWYYSAVETAFAHGAITQQENNFRPNDAITREEMAVMLVRALGYGTISGLAQDLENPFTDVGSSLGYLSMAYELNLMSGNASGRFEPDKAATREQAAVVLTRLYDRLHAAAPSVCGIASSPDNVNQSGVDTVAVPAMKLIFSGDIQLINDLSETSVSAVRTAEEGKRQLMQVSGTSLKLQNTDVSALADKIVQAASGGAWDGVLLDFSKLTGTEEASLTALVTAVRTGLGSEKLLFVVAEAPSWKGATAYNGYNFAALAAQADQVILRVISYNQQVSGFPTAPREPLEEVYYALAKLNGAIPAEKLSLWISSFGTAWKGESAIGDLSPAEIAVLLQSPRTTTHWSARYGSAYLSSTTEGITTVVWYHDAQAAQARRQLLSLFGGAGFCVSDISIPLNQKDGLLAGLTG